MPRHISTLFLKSCITLTAVALIAAFGAFRAGSPREAYVQVSGVITHYGPQFQHLPHRNKGKLRYIMLDNKLPVCELFIGKEWGDFSPESERLDDLRTGDKVNIYYEDKGTLIHPEVNRHATYIDIGPENYYRKGNALKPLMFAIILLCLLIMAGVIVLKKIGKIR